MNPIRTIKYFLKKKLKVRVWKFDRGTTITGKNFFISTDKHRWYVFPTIEIDYRPWNLNGSKYLVFFYWLNLLIRNE